MTTSPEIKAKRPLSPHLQVYKPQMTSVLSIFHRMAGVALAIGTLMVAWWLIAAATSEQAYNDAQAFAECWLGTLMIFGWSVALFYHLSNGVRHLFWDTGRLFKIENAYRAGYVVIASTIILTAAAWFGAYANYASQGTPEQCKPLTSSMSEAMYQRCLKDGICSLPNVNCARSPITGKPLLPPSGE